MYVLDIPKNKTGLATWASKFSTFRISHFFVNLYCLQGALIVTHKYVDFTTGRRQCYLVYSRKSRHHESNYSCYTGLKYVSAFCLRGQLDFENLSFRSIISHFWQILGAYVCTWYTEKQNRFCHLGKHIQHISHFSFLCQFVLSTGSADSVTQICRFHFR